MKPTLLQTSRVNIWWIDEWTVIKKTAITSMAETHYTKTPSSRATLPELKSHTTWTSYAETHFTKITHPVLDLNFSRPHKTQHAWNPKSTTNHHPFPPISHPQSKINQKSPPISHPIIQNQPKINALHLPKIQQAWNPTKREQEKYLKWPSQERRHQSPPQTEIGAPPPCAEIGVQG